MMALKDHAAAPAFACATARMIEQLTKDDSTTLSEWCANGRSIHSISKALRAEYGPKSPTDKSLRLHFIGGCSCTSPADSFYGAWR